MADERKETKKKKKRKTLDSRRIQAGDYGGRNEYGVRKRGRGKWT